MNHHRITTSIVLLALLAVVWVGAAGAKSLYVIASHNGTYSAYNINPDGTVSWQANYPSGAWGPAGIAVHSASATLFVTYEFSGSVVLVDAGTMTGLGAPIPAPGASDLAGIDVDDMNDVVYAVDRFTQNVYAYDWNPTTTTLTLQPGYPQTLGSCEGALGIALDEIIGVLYVSCSTSWGSGTVRGYDVTTWNEVMSYVPVVPPVGIAVDRVRGLVYVTAPAGGCAYAPSSYTKLSRYDLATSTETVVDLGHGGMGLAVDELTGYVYVTGGCDGDDLSVWDTNLAMVQSTGSIGSPAGLTTGNVSYNPLHLTKDDGLDEDGCVAVGGTVTYQICFDNLANPFDVTSVVVTDDLPSEMNFVSATGGGTYSAGPHRATWNVGTLTAGSSQVCVDLVASVDSATAPESLLTNLVTIDSAETPATTVDDVTTEVCESKNCPDGEQGAFITSGSLRQPIAGVSRGDVCTASIWVGERFDMAGYGSFALQLTDGTRVQNLIYGNCFFQTQEWQRYTGTRRVLLSNPRYVQITGYGGFKTFDMVKLDCGNGELVTNGSFEMPLCPDGDWVAGAHPPPVDWTCLNNASGLFNPSLDQHHLMP